MRRLVICVLFVTCPMIVQYQVFQLWSQSFSQAADPFESHVPSITLKDQSILDAIAALGPNSNIAFSIEFPLGTTISSDAPPLRKLDDTIAAGTVAEVLDRLCTIDPTFTWIKIGNTANILPRAKVEDPRYVLNRKIDHLNLSNVSNAWDAVLATVNHLPGTREQIAILQIGTGLNFPRSWSVTFTNVTLREAFDDIAQHLGPTYGWQFSGAEDFRIISFHQRLAPRPHLAAPSN